MRSTSIVAVHYLSAQQAVCNESMDSSPNIMIHQGECSVTPSLSSSLSRLSKEQRKSLPQAEVKEHDKQRASMLRKQKAAARNQEEIDLARLKRAQQEKNLQSKQRKCDSQEETCLSSHQKFVQEQQGKTKESVEEGHGST